MTGSLSVARFRPCKSLLPVAFLSLNALIVGACTEAESRDAPETEPAAAVEGAAPVAEAPADEATVTARRTVPAGTSLTFGVDETISTETHQPGDRFTATLTSNVTDVEGDEVIGAGTASQWVVTESTTEDDQSLLAVALESIQVDGEWMPVVATVTEADVDADDPDTGGETAAKVGVGAAAGALIGQILGRDTESTLKGAGVGAAVGAVVALTTRGGSATLPADSRVVVQLDEPLSIS